MQRLVRVVVLTGILSIPVLPAVAAPVPPVASVSVAGPAVVASQAEPAVEIDLFEEEERPESAWTFKVLVPASLFLGALTVVVSFFLYFPKVVLKRYQTID